MTTKKVLPPWKTSCRVFMWKRMMTRANKRISTTIMTIIAIEAFKRDGLADKKRVTKVENLVRVVKLPAT